MGHHIASAPPHTQGPHRKWDTMIRVGFRSPSPHKVHPHRKWDNILRVGASHHKGHSPMGQHLVSGVQVAILAQDPHCKWDTILRAGFKSQSAHKVRISSSRYPRTRSTSQMGHHIASGGQPHTVRIPNGTPYCEWLSRCYLPPYYEEGPALREVSPRRWARREVSQRGSPKRRCQRGEPNDVCQRGSPKRFIEEMSPRGLLREACHAYCQSRPSRVRGYLKF